MQNNKTAALMEKYYKNISGGTALFKINVPEKSICCSFIRFGHDFFAEIKNPPSQLNNDDSSFDFFDFIDECVCNDEKEHVKSDILNASASGRAINISFKSAKNVLFHFSADKVGEDNGCAVYCAIFTRISEQEILFRKIVNESDSGVYICNVNTRDIVYISESMCKMFGLNDGAAYTGMKCYKAIYGLNSPCEDCRMENCRLDKYIISEKSFPNSNRSLLVKSRLFNWNGSGIRMNYVSDESQRIKSQRMLTDLINKLPGGIGVFTYENGKITTQYLNNGYYSLLDREAVSGEHLADENPLKRIYPDDRVKLFEEIDTARRLNRNVKCVCRIFTNENKLKYIDINGSLVRRDGDICTYFVSMNDIDEMKKNADSLRSNYETQLLYRESMQLHSCASLIINITENTITERKSSTHIHSEIMNCDDADELFKRISENIPYVDERTTFLNIYNRSNILEKYSVNCRIFENEHHFIFDDHKVHWESTNLEIIENPRTHCLEGYFSFEDITARKREQLIFKMGIDKEIDFISYVELKTERIKMIQCRDDAISLPTGEEHIYSEWVKVLTETVCEDDSEFVSEFELLNLIDFLRLEREHTIVIHTNGTPEKRRIKKFRMFYLDSTREYLVVVRHDITDVMRNEEEKKQALRRAALEAQQANAAKSDFLSRMSHDIRTPMNGIIGMAQIGIDECKDEKIRDYIQTIYSSGKFLLGLINDILDMSKIENKKMELHPEPYSTRECIDSLMIGFRLQIEEKHIDFTFREDNKDIKGIFVDKLRYQQIWSNLISNAIKYTGIGGKIDIYAHQLEYDGEYVTGEYSITDNGIGMSESFSSHIFDAFVQENTNANTLYKGTGLGLTIVKNLVEMMNGKISVKSSSGNGTCFTMIFRFKCTDTERVNIKPINDDQDFSGKRILIAEDNDINRDIARLVLEKHNIEIDEAINGKIALDKYLTHKSGYYDAILMDIRMPEMNGLDAAEAIRASGKDDAGKIAIIAMTANAFSSDMDETRKAGMNEHLSKPIDVKALMFTLAKYLT